jgi:glucuronate isomerase
VPNTIGNPLYHWTHLELSSYFGIDTLLNRDTAEAIWKETREKLQSPEFSTQSLLKKDSVVFLGTTDDPADALTTHEQLRQSNLPFDVSPSYRPDQALHLEKESFSGWIRQLAELTGRSISSYGELLAALDERIEAFDALGTRSSDHGMTDMVYEPASEAEAAAVFQKRMSGETVTAEEAAKYKTYTLLHLAERYAAKDWVMQLHLHPLRNTNTAMFQRLGGDSGFDAIHDQLPARPLAAFLDQLEQHGALPKTVLYSVNPNNNNTLAAIAGSFQSSEIPGKVQVGTAWWFNDHIDGMESQMKSLASIGLISNFIGMLTDSRSFLSFSRHEYFRRILCNLIGTWVEEGKAPNDLKLLSTYVENICYYNAKKYFSI